MIWVRVWQSLKGTLPENALNFYKKENVIIILEQLVFYKKDHKVDREYQLWQEGIHPKLMQTDVMMMSFGIY